MAVHSAVAFLLLSLGLLIARRKYGLVAVLWRDDAGGFIARRLLPMTLLIPLLVGELRLLGERQGLYGGTFGTSAFVLATVVLLVSVVLWTARQLSGVDASRQAAENALRLSEARLAGIISTAADAIISIDAEHRITLFNEGAEHIFGYSRSEALGQPLEMLLPARLRATHAELVRGFATGQDPARFMETRGTLAGLRHNGEEFPAEATIAKQELGGKMLLTVILRDVSGHHRARETLEASERRFRTAFEDAPSGISLMSLEGAFLNVNASLCKLLGYPPEELLAKTLRDVLWPEDLEEDHAKMLQLQEGGPSSHQLEQRYRHQKGHLITVVSTASLVRDAQGRPHYFIRQLQDISERKRLESALKTLAEAGPRLAGTLELPATLEFVAKLMVPMLADWCVVGLFDENAGLRWAAGTAAEARSAQLVQELITTYPGATLFQGCAAADLLPMTEPSLSECPALDAVPEERLRELLGGLRCGALIRAPLRTSGRLLGILILARNEAGPYQAWDLTLAGELAHRAALAIDNARLHTKSEQAIQTRDEVLRIVAHDLRGPLNVVSLSAEVLKERLAPERTEDRKRLDAILRAVSRSNQLIRDLLDMAQLEAHHLSLVLGPEETRSLVEESFMLHRPLAEARAIRLDFSLMKDCPPLLVDRNRVLQILSNLLGNALKFTREGGTVTLRVEAARNMLRFCVSDSGVGISTLELPHLFEPFWQARPGKRDGAGLGLSIVKGLVEAHGGALQVESTLGVGSTFSFTLPTAA